MEQPVIVASFRVLNVPYIEFYCCITSIHFLWVIYHNYVQCSFITSPGPNRNSAPTSSPLLNMACHFTE